MASKNGIKSLERVMTFNEVLSAATDIARANSGMFLKAIMLYAGPFMLVRVILSLDFIYRKNFLYTVASNKQYILTTEGLISSILSIAGVAILMVVANRVSSQYTSGGKIIQRSSDLLKGRQGWIGSMAGLMIIQSLIIGFSIFILGFIISSSGEPGMMVLLVIGGLFLLGYLFSSLAMSPFAILEENRNSLNAIDRSFSLAAGNRWTIFGLGFVTMLMTYFVVIGISFISGISYYFFFMTGIPDFSRSFPLLAVIELLTNVVMLIGTGLTMLVLSVQYHNLVERKEAKFLAKRIEQLGNN